MYDIYHTVTFYIYDTCYMYDIHYTCLTYITDSLHCIYYSLHCIYYSLHCIYCNTLQHTATHCNTLQHTATHYNTLQHTALHILHILQSLCIEPAPRERGGCRAGWSNNPSTATLLKWSAVPVLQTCCSECQ